MNQIIKYSIKHPTAIMSYSLLVIITGILSLCFIQMDFLPKLNDRTLLVSTSFYGIPSSQMKEIITKPIEDSFSSLKGIKNISSVTRDNFSFIKIELHYGTNINTALIESRQIIDNVTPLLPNECSKPQVEIFSPSKNDLLTICAIPKNNEFILTRYICENEIKHQLLTLNGVGKIRISGGLEEEVKLFYDQQFLCSKKLNTNILSQTIMQTNYEYPAGTIKNYDNEYILKTSNLYKSYDDILETLIPTDAEPIALKDIVKLQISNKEKETFSYYNNSECISIEIQKKTNSNPIKTSKLIKKKIDELNKKFNNINFIIVKDNAIEIKNSVISVFISALIGTIITFFVIFFFLKNLKISLIVSSPIIFCILFSISILKLFDKTINLFSLSGISIAIGMIVDATIIVTENIITNCSKISAKSKFDQTLFYSISSLNKSNLSSALTTIIVFIPFFFLPGIFGELFTDLSIAIISSILFSFFLSITFIPAIIKTIFKNSIQQVSINNFISTIQKNYENILFKTIAKKSIRHTLIFISLLIGIIFSIIIKKEFIQPAKTNQFKIKISYPTNYTLEKIQTDTKKLLNQISKEIKNTTIYTLGGIEKNDYYKLSDLNENESTTTIIFFTNSKNNKSKIIQFLENKHISFRQEQSLDLISKAFGINNNYIITEDDKTKFDENFFSNQNLIPVEFVKETTFIPEDAKCAFYKIPKYYISQFIYQLLNGTDAGFFFKDTKMIPIKILPNVQNNTDVTNLSIELNNNLIPIYALGKFSINTTNKIYYRFNKQNAFQTKEKPTNIDAPNIISLSKKQFDELKENSILILFIVIILLYSILGAEFEDFVLPLIFLISTIPSFAGALFFLTFFNQTLNANSFLSLVILFGITVNNSIILFESLQKNDKTKEQFIKKFSNKIQAILITTTTSFVALIPFAFDPFGINTQSSISIAICGGLIFGVIIVLIIIPNILFFYKKQI